eukprot:1393856-Amorphochlora_amoeboformis.AAC.1
MLKVRSCVGSGQGWKCSDGALDIAHPIVNRPAKITIEISPWTNCRGVPRLLVPDHGIQLRPIRPFAPPHHSNGFPPPSSPRHPRAGNRSSRGRPVGFEYPLLT